VDDGVGSTLLFNMIGAVYDDCQLSISGWENNSTVLQCSIARDLTKKEYGHRKPPALPGIALDAFCVSRRPLVYGTERWFYIVIYTVNGRSSRPSRFSAVFTWTVCS